MREALHQDAIIEIAGINSQSAKNQPSPRSRLFLCLLMRGGNSLGCCVPSFVFVWQSATGGARRVTTSCLLRLLFLSHLQLRSTVLLPNAGSAFCSRNSMPPAAAAATPAITLRSHGRHSASTLRRMIMGCACHYNCMGWWRQSGRQAASEKEFTTAFHNAFCVQIQGQKRSLNEPKCCCHSTELHGGWFEGLVKKLPEESKM